MVQRQKAEGTEQVPQQTGHTAVLRGFARHTAVLRAPAAVRAGLLVLLAAASGYIDAVSYLAFGQVFTSNMTGNTVLLGMAIGQGTAGAASRSAVALAGYVVGVTAGSAIVDRGEQRVVWPASVTAGLAAEALVLLALAVAAVVAGPTPSDALLFALIALAAVAMGIQSVAVRALGVSGVTTTYITGTWTSLVTSVTGWLSSALRLGNPARPAPPPPASAGLQAAVVVIYVLAAIAGAVAEARWFLRAAALPAGAIVLVLVVAFLRFRHPEQSPEQ